MKNHGVRNKYIAYVVVAVLLYGAWELSGYLLERRESKAAIAELEDKKNTGIKAGIKDSLIREYLSKEFDESLLRGTFEGEFVSETGGILLPVNEAIDITYRFDNGTLYKVVDVKTENLLFVKKASFNGSAIYKVKGSVLHVIHKEGDREIFISKEPVSIDGNKLRVAVFSEGGNYQWVSLEKQW